MLLLFLRTANIYYYFFDELIIYMPALNSMVITSMFHPLKQCFVTGDLQTNFTQNL